MYESSCSYQSALDLKRVAASAAAAQLNIKTEVGADCGPMSGGAMASAPGGDWASGCYRFAAGLPAATSTFEQLKQSVEKAKAALQSPSAASAVPQVNGGYLSAASVFGDLAAPLTGFARDEPLRGHTRIHQDDDHKRSHSGECQLNFSYCIIFTAKNGSSVDSLGIFWI